MLRGVERKMSVGKQSDVKKSKKETLLFLTNDSSYTRSRYEIDIVPLLLYYYHHQHHYQIIVILISIAIIPNANNSTRKILVGLLLQKWMYPIFWENM